MVIAWFRLPGGTVVVPSCCQFVPSHAQVSSSPLPPGTFPPNSTIRLRRESNVIAGKKRGDGIGPVDLDGFLVGGVAGDRVLERIQVDHDQLEGIDAAGLEVAERSVAADGTRKFLFRLRDGQTVESVIIPMEEHATFCISTQVGCGVGCVFCASGADGVIRLLIANTEIGQGTNTVMPMIAAEVLGVDPSEVELAPVDTSIVPNSGPTVASRTVMIVGGLVEGACDDLRRRLGLRDVWIKDESPNPTGSFKARGMSAAITRAVALGAQAVALPSAGNAAGDAAAGDAAAALAPPPRRKATAASRPRPCWEVTAVAAGLGLTAKLAAPAVEAARARQTSVTRDGRKAMTVFSGWAARAAFRSCCR